jgi:hypothetical protein
MEVLRRACLYANHQGSIVAAINSHWFAFNERLDEFKMPAACFAKISFMLSREAIIRDDAADRRCDWPPEFDDDAMSLGELAGH